MRSSSAFLCFSGRARVGHHDVVRVQLAADAEEPPVRVVLAAVGALHDVDARDEAQLLVRGRVLLRGQQPAMSSSWNRGARSDDNRP